MTVTSGTSRLPKNLWYTSNYLLQYELSRPFFLFTSMLASWEFSSAGSRTESLCRARGAPGHLNHRVILAGARVHIDAVAQTCGGSRGSV